jgi:hypothetical protein
MWSHNYFEMVKICYFTVADYTACGSGQFNWYSDLLRSYGPGIAFFWGSRFFVPLQTGPGTHIASYTMGAGSLSPGGKRSSRGVNHPPHHSAEVKEIIELYLYSHSGPSWMFRSEICLLNAPCYILLRDSKGSMDHSENTVTFKVEWKSFSNH